MDYRRPDKLDTKSRKMSVKRRRKMVMVSIEKGVV